MTGAASKLTVAEYLALRVRQLGIEHVFGVPGDFNLPLLDFISPQYGLNWVGNCNELNASYAADGYARVKGLPGVMVTTFNVGELSALNGIVGAYNEYVPILHIVGVPNEFISHFTVPVHHSIGSSDGLVKNDISHQIAKLVSVASVVLKSDENFDNCKAIDQVISKIMTHSRPGYIFIPTNVILTEVPVTTDISKPLKLSYELDILEGPQDENPSQSAHETIVELLYASRKPVLIVDATASRFHSKELVNKVIDTIKVPVVSTTLGRGIVDEGRSYYKGIYAGELSSPSIVKLIKQSDLLIHLGPMVTDLNTGAFSFDYSNKTCVFVHPDHVTVSAKGQKGEQYDLKTFEVHFRRILESFLDNVSAKCAEEVIGNWEWDSEDAKENTEGGNDDHQLAKTNPALLTSITTTISQHLEKARLEHDRVIFIQESGSLQFATPDIRFPNDTTFISQGYYASIGYSLPAALGAYLADDKASIFLLIGDGSAQISIQELSRMTRLDQSRFNIVLVNNNGYTIERALWLKGYDSVYNDIPQWDWVKLVNAFGGEAIRVKGEELDSALEKSENLLIEMVIPKDLQSWRIDALVSVMSKVNKALKEHYEADKLRNLRMASEGISTVKRRKFETSWERLMLL